MAKHCGSSKANHRVRRSNRRLYSALNAICPYYTMFPLEFPLSKLRRYKERSLRVLDPFCGRGTTILAARLKGHQGFGIDSSPVATAIALAKTATTRPEEVIDLAREILDKDAATDAPTGEFWEWAFAKKTLRDVCALRDGLRAKRSDSARVLRAICLGALHGPLTKDPRNQSYFSNQMPRTFAAKPAYSVRFWRERELRPREVGVLDVIKRRIERLALCSIPASLGSPKVHTADSRYAHAYSGFPEEIDLAITSPPYYGMQTYIADQWLRNWFIGGPSHVDYRENHYLSHHTPDAFSRSLSKVWNRIGERLTKHGRLFVRFGAIPSRKVNSKRILIQSFEFSCFSWKLCRVRRRKSPAACKRQASHMGSRVKSVPVGEYDFEFALS